jgi:glycosyltransferase involved in cell wall biosynthesis
MKLSIITICHNEIKGIKSTIQSVLNQVFRDFEYLVIDGNSTDGTREIIESYKDKLDLFISENDSGIYSAMNKGLSRAKGEFILFLNGGDYLYNEKVLADVFSFEIRKPIIYGYCETRTSINTPTLFRAPKNLTKFHLIKTSIPHQATFVRRELFLKYGMFDETFKIAGDYDLLLRFVVKYSVKTQYVPVLCSYFDRNGISSTRHDLREHEKGKARSINFSQFDLLYYPIVNRLLNELRLLKRGVRKLLR